MTEPGGTPDAKAADRIPNSAALSPAQSTASTVTSAGSPSNSRSGPPSRLGDPMPWTDPGDWKDRWRDNHVNGLLGFVAAIAVVGVLLMWMMPDPVADTSVATENILTLDDPAIDMEATRAAQAADQFRIVVAGRGGEAGWIRLAIYDSPESFNQTPLATFRTSILPEEDGLGSVMIDRSTLPSRIAVAAFHDLNGDDVLNANLLGVPEEPYGFTNRARGILGPPRFEDAVIDLPPAGAQLNLPLR